MNNFLGMLSSPWAIEPSKLLEIQGLYAARLRDEKADIAAIERRIGRPLANEARAYENIDGVAVLPIEGVIAKKMNMLMQISGGTSAQLAEQSLRAAINDSAVHSIVLSIDSPGGTVDGTETLAKAVFEARSAKQIVSLASGCMCSAAYWIGSAAQSVYIADRTTTVGSIGVVTSHVDVSGAQSLQGLKTTEISAGKYKRIASNYAPLSSDGKQSIQDQVDYLYSLFVDAVAKNRNVATNVVLRDMADGKIFIGKQSIDAGLVDGIATLPGLISMLNESKKSGASIRKIEHGSQPMTREALDHAAKTYMRSNPGVDYISAIKMIAKREATLI